MVRFSVSVTLRVIIYYLNILKNNFSNEHEFVNEKNLIIIRASV